MRGVRLLLVAAFAAGHAQALRAAEPALGTPALSADDLQSAAKGGACDASTLPGKPGGGQIKRYKLTFIASFTEYDPDTCKPHGAGSWTLVDQEICDTGKCGKVTTGIIQNKPLSSGACPGKTFDFASVCYTWEKHSNVKVTDNVTMLYEPPRLSPVLKGFELKVPVVYPDTESTSFAGWRKDGYGKWRGKVKNSDPKFDWSLNLVREADPGGGDPANDSCWCEGSIYDPFYRISGGTWEVSEDGGWGVDNIGYGQEITAYYRTKRRAPCGTSFRQQMQFQAEQVSEDWVEYGAPGTLKASMTYQTITSSRLGKSETKTFQPQPKKKRLDCTAFDRRPIAPARLGSEIVVSGSRPVAEAVREIERLSGQVVTYEDAPIADPGAVAPMVAGGDAAFAMPRIGRLSFEGPETASLEAAGKAVEAALAAYEAGRPAARFALLRSGDALHVVPVAISDTAGRSAKVMPALDVRVSVPGGRRSALDALDQWRLALAAALGRPVGLGAAPLATLQARRIEFSANGEPAREALSRLLAATGIRLSWRLLYDPGTKEYALNLAEVAAR